MQDILAALPSLIAGHGDIKEVREAVAFAAWRKVAGEALCEQTSPVALIGNRLVVAVASKAWQRHLSDLSGEMIFRINSFLGSSAVRFIEFRIDEATVENTRKPKKPDAEYHKEAMDAVTPSIRRAAHVICDLEMRQQFLLAAGSCIAHQKRMREIEITEDAN